MTEETKPQVCEVCHRKRTLADPAYPMDAFLYSPLQVVNGRPLGWYSGPDGEICPEDMTAMLARQ